MPPSTSPRSRNHTACLARLNKWWEGSGSLPEFYSHSASKIFFIQARRRCRKVSNQAAEMGTAESMRAMLENHVRLNAFMEWADFVNPNDAKIADISASWSQSYSRLLGGLSAGPLLYQIKRVMAYEENSSLRHALTHFRQYLEDSRLGSDVENEVIVRHERRLARAELFFPMGVHFDSWEIEGLPRYIQKDISDEAKKEGWEDNWLPRAHPNLSLIASLLSDEKSREVAWDFSQPDTSRQAELKDLLTSRRQSCRRGYSFASKALETHAISDPNFVQNILHGTLKRLAPINRARQANLQVFSDRKFDAIDVSLPWNKNMVMTAIDQAVPVSATARDDLFPVTQTVLRVVPDVLRAVGWSCDSTDANHQGILSFDCQKPDGQKVLLLIRPVTRSSERLSDIDGVFTSMDQVWLGSQETLTGAVDVFLPEKCEYFTPQKIINMVHELGHMVHYLSMPKTEVFGEVLFPSDLVEFPSQLLERFVTPSKLAAWARPTAAAVYKTEAYWRTLMVNDAALWSLDESLEKSINASLDLDMHLPGHRSINGVHNNLRALAGMAPADARATEHHAAFMWRNDYAARNYVYLWGEFLIEQVLPPNPSSTMVAKCFKEFINQVGSQAIIPEDVRKNWRKWRGESLRDSVSSGAKKWAAHVTETTEKVMSTNRLLAASNSRVRPKP